MPHYSSSKIAWPIHYPRYYFSLMSPISTRRRLALVYVVILLSLLGVIYWIYSASFGAWFSFDDVHNLNGLEQVHDFSSALVFVFSGNAGPSGRPLALASFLINLKAWPDSPGDFLFVNTLIHLLNTVLVLIVLRRMLRLAPALQSNAAWIALLTTALWTLSPLLASTSFNVVQRMTSLSASFMLVGLWLYLIGRARLAQRPWFGLIWMGVGIGFGTVLATFSKESGALLPLYALVMEFTLLRQVPLPSSRIFRWCARGLVLVPVGVLLLYLATFNFEGGYAHRPFTLPERLYTQWVILWDYVRQGFLPNIETLGVFHDDYPIYRDLLDPVVLISLSGWTGALMLAILLRRNYPLFSFAVFWYLAGHLLESTIIGLELYFEHRNYLPMLGPYLLLVYTVWQLPSHYRVLNRSMLLVYIGLQGVMLWQVSSLWGQPHQASQAWYAAHPDSRRAAQHLASFYVWQYQLAPAHALVVEAANRNPGLTDLQIQSLQLGCAIEPQDRFQDRLAAVLGRLHTGQYSNATLIALNQLTNLHLSGECSQINALQIHELIDALRYNPFYVGARMAQHHLHHIDARLYAHQRLLKPTLHHLEQAFLSHPNVDTAIHMAATMQDAGLKQEALKFLDEAIEYAPRNPILKNAWVDRIEAFRLKK